MSKSRYIKLFSFSILTLALGAVVVYANTDFRNPVTKKVSSFLVGGIEQQTTENTSIGNETSSDGYFSIFNFITNLAPKN